MSTAVNLVEDLSPDFQVGVTVIGTTSSQVLPIEIDVCKGVQLKADPANTGIIHIGRSNVTASTGMPLAAGEGLFIPVSDVTKISAVASAAAQNLHWLTV